MDSFSRCVNSESAGYSGSASVTCSTVPRSNSDSCPSMLWRRLEARRLENGSITAIICARGTPNPSSADARIRLSTIFRLSVLSSMRRIRSPNEPNGPFFSRSAIRERIAASPTFLTAARAKRIAPFSVVNRAWLRLMSGGSTAMFIARQTRT